MKRTFLFFMVLVLVFSAALYAGGGGQKGAPADGAKKTRLVWGDWAMAEDVLRPIYQRCLDSFTAKNPDVEIEVFSLPYSNYLDQLLIAGAAGNAPDVVRVQNVWIPQFGAIGALRDIRSYVEKSVIDDYYPGALDSLTINNQLVGLTWMNSAYILYYNKALLQKAGITQLPKNLDELVAAANRISALGTDERGNRLYGIVIPASGGVEPNEGINILPMLWGYGGDLTDSSGRITLTNAPAIKAFSAIQKIYVDGVSPLGTTFKDLRNLFGQGVIGFAWDLAGTGASAMAQAAPDRDAFMRNLGTMVIPREGGPNGHGYLTEQSMIVFKSCGNEKMPAMGRFLAHQSSSDVLEILYNANQGKTSSRKSVMEGVLANVDNPIFLTGVEATKSGRYLPYSLNLFDMDKLLSDALTRLAQKEDVNSVMRDTQTKIQAVAGR